MKKYVLQKTLKERKAGQIIELDNNSFFTIYWLKKGVISELQGKQQKVQDTETNAVKTPKKAVKKGNKKK